MLLNLLNRGRRESWREKRAADSPLVLKLSGYFNTFWTHSLQGAAQVSAVTAAQHPGICSLKTTSLQGEMHRATNATQEPPWMTCPDTVLIYLWTSTVVKVRHGWKISHGGTTRLPFYAKNTHCPVSKVIIFDFASLFHRLLYNVRMGFACSALHCRFLQLLWSQDIKYYVTWDVR